LYPNLTRIRFFALSILLKRNPELRVAHKMRTACCPSAQTARKYAMIKAICKKLRLPKVPIM
jgi:hypothetical protein